MVQQLKRFVIVEQYHSFIEHTIFHLYVNFMSLVLLIENKKI